MTIKEKILSVFSLLKGMIERKVNRNELAATFSADKTYKVGEMVVYDDVVYRCTNEHSGAWIGSDFEKSTIDESVRANCEIASKTSTAFTEWKDGENVSAGKGSEAGASSSESKTTGCVAIGVNASASEDDSVSIGTGAKSHGKGTLNFAADDIEKVFLGDVSLAKSGLSGSMKVVDVKNYATLQPSTMSRFSIPADLTKETDLMFMLEKPSRGKKSEYSLVVDTYSLSEESRKPVYFCLPVNPENVSFSVYGSANLFQKKTYVYDIEAFEADEYGSYAVNITRSEGSEPIGAESIFDNGSRVTVVGNCMGRQWIADENGKLSDDAPFEGWECTTDTSLIIHATTKSLVDRVFVDWGDGTLESIDVEPGKGIDFSHTFNFNSSSFSSDALLDAFRDVEVKLSDSLSAINGLVVTGTGYGSGFKVGKSVEDIDNICRYDGDPTSFFRSSTFQNSFFEHDIEAGTPHSRFYVEFTNASSGGKLKTMRSAFKGVELGDRAVETVGWSIASIPSSVIDMSSAFANTTRLCSYEDLGWNDNLNGGKSTVRFEEYTPPSGLDLQSVTGKAEGLGLVMDEAFRGANWINHAIIPPHAVSAVRAFAEVVCIDGNNDDHINANNVGNGFVGLAIDMPDSDSYVFNLDTTEAFANVKSVYTVNGSNREYWPETGHGYGIYWRTDISLVSQRLSCAEGMFRNSVITTKSWAVDSDSFCIVGCPEGASFKNMFEGVVFNNDESNVTVVFADTYGNSPNATPLPSVYGKLSRNTNLRLNLRDMTGMFKNVKRLSKVYMKDTGTGEGSEEFYYEVVYPNYDAKFDIWPVNAKVDECYYGCPDLVGFSSNLDWYTAYEPSEITSGWDDKFLMPARITSHANCVYESGLETYFTSDWGGTKTAE